MTMTRSPDEEAVLRAALWSERERAAARADGLRRDLDAIIEAAALTPPDDEHDPEGATVGFERALVSDLLAQARSTLVDLDAALAGLDAGTLGRCEGCRQAIPLERLTANPTTRCCVSCSARPAQRPGLRTRG